MNRLLALVASVMVLSSVRADVDPPNNGRGAGTVPIWNPHKPGPGNPPLTVRVLVLNYDPIVPGEGQKTLSQVFKWNSPADMIKQYKEAMEYATGGYITFDLVEIRYLNEIYAQNDGKRYTIEEYVKNRRTGKGWRPNIMADYPRLLKEQNVPALIDDGKVDEVWIFSDHYFGVWEASMAGPGSFFINGGVYPEVPTRRPFAFYGFNYERGVAEMMHNTSHRTEATMNRAYAPWNLKQPGNNWEKFSANDKQSNGVAGVGTCHWPANAEGDYDYGNRREVSSWGAGFLRYPQVDFTRKIVSRDTWWKGPNYHLDYMKYYFAHLPRAAGVNADGRQNNWLKYIFDFQSYDAKGQPLSPSAELTSGHVTDPKATTHRLRVAYRSAEQADERTLGDDDLTVTAPDGQRLKTKLVSGNESANRSYRVAHYEVTALTGSWNQAGSYRVELGANQVKTRSGTAFPAGMIGGFRVVRPGEMALLNADKSTTFLTHFDDTALGADKSAPEQEKGLRFVPGVVGKAASFETGSLLSYRTEGKLDPRAGTVEFWVKPNWANATKTGRIMFQAGRAFDNAILVQVDGANNLRVITWGDDPATPTIEKNVERGLGVSAGGWIANDWHHVAVTWAESGRKLILYVDGRPVGSLDNGIVISKFATPTFTIGSGPSGSSPALAAMDELRISSVARSETEIRDAAQR